MAAELQISIDSHDIAPPAVPDGPGRAARSGRPPVPVMVPRAPLAAVHAAGAAPISVATDVAEAGPTIVPRAPASTDDIDGNAVRSVDRAAALLIALGSFAGEAGVTELARRLGLHKSTASRLLATLQRRGLVEQDEETGKYRLGLVVIRLAERAEATLDLRGIAMPEMEHLARETRETIGLTTLDRDTAMTVAQVDGPNMVACPDWTGRATPLHCVAAGKVLLSTFAERDVLRLVKQGLDARTDRTIIKLEPLLEELARVRRRDYATTFGEWEAGINGVAVPVRDARGRIRGRRHGLGARVPDRAGPGARPRRERQGSRGGDLVPDRGHSQLTAGWPGGWPPGRAAMSRHAACGP